MKRVVSEANGGLSVISAFTGSTGAAMSIDLGMKCTIGEARGKKSENVIISMLTERFGISRNYSVRIESNIPSGYGLKSSSAYVLSIVSSFLRFEDINMDDVDVLRLSSELSKKAGISRTGALDDLCQSYYGGFCMTDNARNRILVRRRVPEYPVLLSIRGKKRLSSEVNMPANSGNSFRALEKLVYAGYMFEPMVINGFLYGSIMGIDMDAVKKMVESSAMYSSQSGKGPAVFGIFSERRRIDDAARKIGDRTIRTRLSNSGLKVKVYED